MTIRIEHTDGTVETLEHLQSKVIRKFGETGLARLFTPRALANQVTLEEGRDEVYLEDDTGNDVFGGRLKDIERDGSSVELVVDSFERDARKAEPTSAGQRRENVADDVLIREAVDAIPGLSAGTIQQIETGLTFVFSHSSQAKKIRTVEQATSGEVRYNADKTVDYVDRLGQDRSGSVTISPGNQNLDGKIKVKENGGQKNVTHLRMLGAGEGKHQMVVNVVPDTDTASYENKVTYTDHDWQDGDFEDWDTYINKEVTDTATLEREGLTLIDELNSKFIELEATIKGVDVDLGDTVYVQKPKDNIDQSLRIVEWQRVDDKDGLRYDCVLSSRLKTREKPGTKDRKDIQRYNKGFEGTPVTLNTGGGRQPVSVSHNYEFHVYYPAEVEYEHRVKLHVNGLAYRAYSEGAASNGGPHSHTVSIGDHSHSVTISSHSHGFTLPSHIHAMDFNGSTTNLATSNMFNDGGNVAYHDHTVPTPTFTNPPENLASSTTDAGGETTETTSNGGGTSTTSSSESGNHTHEPEPGIIQSFGGTRYYPGNCDVHVNGQSQNVSLGDGTGPFEETVDLRGDLNPGQWNTIEISTGSLGHIQAHLDVDVYRQILGDG